MTYARPFGIALFLFTLLPPLGSATEANNWTAESALKAVQQRNLELRATRAEVEFSEAQKSEAVALWLPRGELKASAGLGPGYKGSALAGYQDDDDWGPVLRGGVDAGIPLFAFGQLLVVQELARRGVEVAEAKLMLKQQHMLLEMQEALLQVQRVQGRIAAIESRRQRLSALRQLFAKQQSGLEATSIQSQIELLGIDIERELKIESRSKAGAVRAVLGLLNDPTGQLTDSNMESRAFPEEVSGNRCLDLALTHRADFVVGRSLLELGEVNLLLARLRFLPGFALVANYSRRFAPSDTNQVGAFRSDPRNGGGLGALLAAEWDLDLPTRWRELEKADGQLQSGKHQLAFAMADGLYKVSRAFREVVSGQVRRLSGEESLEAARAWYTTASSRFSEGLGTGQDVFDAYRALAKSELEFIDSLVGYEVAIDRLRTHVGVDCWGENPMSAPSP